MKTPTLSIALVAAFSATAVHAQSILLFRDDFSRAASTNLNASTDGQSGTLAPLTWVEQNYVSGTAAINSSGQLVLDGLTDGNSGAVVWPDHNFIGIKGFTVTMQIDSAGSGGDFRHNCFGIGWSAADIAAIPGASVSNVRPNADVCIAYDTIGGTTGFYVYEDGAGVSNTAVAGYPAELKAVFTFADTTDGTTINYDVYLNGGSPVYSGSTTWTGTDQNYIGFSSNYTTNAIVDYVEVRELLDPIVKDDNTDDLNLGTSWVGGTAPTSSVLGVWDSTVTAPNTTVLGGDLTWGGIVVENPGGLVTIGGANTLTLDGPDTAIDLGSADTADLTVGCDLVLSGSSILDVATGRTITVSGAISGSSGIDKQGAGTVILSGSNSYVGDTRVIAGTVRLGASEVIPHGGGGGASGNVTVNGTLDLNTFSESLNGLSGTGVIDTVAGGTPTLTVGYNGQSGAFEGILQNTSGTLSFEKIGNNTIDLGGANTYSGSTTVTGGTLQVSHASALGNTSGVSLADGTSFVPDLDGFTTSAPFTLDTGGTTSFISVPINGDGNGADKTMTLNGPISGDGDLVFTDLDGSGNNSDGIIVLGAASSYTGDTTIDTSGLLGNNTIIRSGTTNALPTTTVLSLLGAQGQGGGRQVTFDLNGNDQTLAGLQNVLQFDRRQLVTSSGAATLTVNNAADFSFGGVGTGTGNDGFARIQGAISLVKSGAGTFSLAGTNTNTGNTAINEGELRIGNGGTTGALNPATDISIASEATFGVNRSNAVVQGTDFSGNPLTGDGNFAQRGTGSTTLNLANTYAGTTTVDAGALVVEHASALGTTAGGTVVNGTTSSGSANARLELTGGVTVTGESLTISGSGSFLGALTSTSGNNVWAGPVTIGASGTRLGASPGASLEVSGVIDSGAVATGLIIRPNDLTGSVILSGANTYLGTTQVLIGVLQLAGGDNRLPVGTTLNLGSSSSNPGAEFDLNGRNQEVAGLELSGSADPTKNTINNSSGTPSTLTVNTPAATPSTFAGILTGNLSIAKSGPDTLSLTGTSNAYTGNTTVNEGTLSLSGINPSNESSTVTIAASGATLDLGFAGTDTVDQLFIGATQMAAGVYGPSATDIPQITGTGTLTVTTGPVTDPFADWASTGTLGPVTFEGDTNADGVQDGIAFLLGVANPDDDATGNLPGVSENGGDLVMAFKCLAGAERGTAALTLEYDGDLAGTWLSVAVPGAQGAPNPIVEATASGTVSFVATDDGTNANGDAMLDIVATISDATESAAGKLFGRLQATNP